MQKNFSVPFIYKMGGMIDIKAESEDEAIELAKSKLSEMTGADLAERASYLPDSEEIDAAWDILVYDPYLPTSVEEENEHMAFAMLIVKSWIEALLNGRKCPDRGSEPYDLFMSWAKEYKALPEQEKPNGEAFIKSKFTLGLYDEPKECPYDFGIDRVITVGMYIEEVYMSALLYGTGMILTGGVENPIPTFIQWAREYDGPMVFRSVESYAFKKIAATPGASVPVSFTVEEYVEDWKTREKKVVESHKIEVPTYRDAFEKAYSYERSLRYCSGHYIRIAEPAMDERYRKWKGNGLTMELYYGGGVVD